MLRAAAVTDNVAARISRQFENVNRNSRTAGGGVDDLGNKLRNLNNTPLNRGGLLGSFVGGNLIASGIQNIGNAVANGIGTIFEQARIQETQLVGLRTFLGKEAEAAYAGMKADAAATPFSLESIVQVNRALISAGVSATQARGDTLALANAIAAVGAGDAELSRMAANLQQIKTVGQATAMDIKQFGMAGINIYKLLSDATGKPIEQVKTMTVSYELLSQALRMAQADGGAYAGALAAQSQTQQGRISTLMDNINLKAAEIGTALMPVTNALLDGALALVSGFAAVMPYLQPAFELLNQLPAIFNDVVTGNAAWAGWVEIAMMHVTTIWDGVRAIGMNIWNIVSGAVRWLYNSQLIRDILWLVGKAFQGIWWVVKQIGSTLEWIWTNILEPILNGIETVYRATKALLGFGGKTVVETVVKTPPGTAPVLPGAGVTPETFTAAAGVPGSGLDAGKPKAESINNGGQRTITINIGKQIENLQVSVLDAQAGVNEIETMVREAMRRVIFNLNAVAT